jgi:hypothetical protein
MNIAREIQDRGLRPAPARIARTLLLASLAPLLLTQAEAHDRVVLQNRSEPIMTIDMRGIRLWLQVRFSETELEGLRPGDLRIERYACGC